MTQAAVSAANDYVFPMVGDVSRNEYYRRALAPLVSASSVALELGAGTGLLAMTAAKLGAKHCVAVGVRSDLLPVVEKVVESNGLGHKVKLIDRGSTAIVLDDIKSTESIAPADILLVESFGTMLLGESAWSAVTDLRRKGVIYSSERASAIGSDPEATISKAQPPTPAKEGASSNCNVGFTSIIPSLGTQYAVLLQSDDLHAITSVAQESWGATSTQANTIKPTPFDLSFMNSFRDTAMVCFSKQFGYRLSSLPYRYALLDFHLQKRTLWVIVPAFKSERIFISADCYHRPSLCLTWICEKIMSLAPVRGFPISTNSSKQGYFNETRVIHPPRFIAPVVVLCQPFNAYSSKLPQLV